jgi:hypothetical protein
MGYQYQADVEGYEIIEVLLANMGNMEIRYTNVVP